MTMRPVTQTADVAVNIASRTPNSTPGFVEKGSKSRRVPMRMSAKAARATV